MSKIIKTRVIPVLLLKDNGLVKTIKFKDSTYVGDPINSVRIFNEKEVDELAFLDITASIENRGPNFKLLEDIAGEAFMPMSYGGGITNMEEIKKLFNIGFEKIILNSSIYKNPKLISEAVKIFGSQSIVASIDVKKNMFGQYKLYSFSGSKKERFDLLNYCKEIETYGIGELLVNSIDLDGTGKGYDIELIKMISVAINIPVIACGGAGCLNDFKNAVEKAGASSVAAGSMFVFMGKHRAVLINYPERDVLTSLLP